MQFQIEIASNNDALMPENVRFEIPRLLELVRTKVLSGADDGVLFDINGNKVGAWYLEGDDD